MQRSTLVSCMGLLLPTAVVGAIVAWRPTPIIQSEATTPTATALPDEEEGPSSFTVLDDGSRLDLDVHPAVPTGPGAVELTADIELTAAEAESQALVFAFDTSYSTTIIPDAEQGCGGDFNGDGSTHSILDCGLASIHQTILSVEDFGSVRDLGLVQFFGTRRPPTSA